MKLCQHIGYYNDPEDIIDIFPSANIKPDMGDIVLKYMRDGYGNFHDVNPGGEIQPFEDFEDDLSGGTAVMTSDGKHLVNFSYGNWKVLAKGSGQHGYYIDIWEVYDEPDIEENEFSGMTDNEILDLASTLSENLKNVVAEIKRRKLL